MIGSLLRARVPAQPPRELEAALARQHPVEEHQVRQLLLDALLGLLRAVGHHDAAPRLLEVQGDELLDGGFVFDDEDVGGHGGLGATVAGMLRAGRDRKVTGLPCRPHPRRAGLP